METILGLAWLAEAADRPACPLCIVTGEFENEYLLGFCQSLVEREDLAEPGKHIAEFVRAPGFCFTHATKFEQAVLNGAASMPDAVDLYLKALEGVEMQLTVLEQDGWLQTADCPACISRDGRLVAAARTLVAAIDQAPRAAEDLLRAGGLCIGHFVLAWESSEEAANRDLLRDIQRNAANELMRQLREIPGHQASDHPEPKHAVTVAMRASRWLSGATIIRR